jgi:siroheme decarboxylase
MEPEKQAMPATQEQTIQPTAARPGLGAADRAILDLIQASFPLVERPFAAIAQKLGLEEADVIQRVRALRESPRPAIRQISAIFDSRALGYESTLVAAKVDPAHLEDAAAVISGHPGVSHNYQRNHAYNLWYTLAVGPDSKLGLGGTLDVLHLRSGAIETHLLPATRMFKIGVKFDLGGDGDLTGRTEGTVAADRPAVRPLTETDKKLIRVLQQDLPIVERPFDCWACQTNLCVADLLAAAKRYEREGRMRRFSAVLRHRDIGFSANGMGVWAVPAGQEQAFGKVAASFSAVSHCYERPTFADWPYNLFTMVHAPDAAQCEAVLAEISRASGIKRYGVLYSSKEFKKKRVQYFTGDIEAWEAGVQSSELAEYPRRCK